MPESKVRRLFNIRAEHVSLVDMAANKRKFVIVKNKEGKIDMADEMKGILDALDDKLEVIEKRLKTIEETEVNPFIVVDKAGARFSKGTLEQLKSTIATLQKLIGDYEEDTKTEKKEEKELSKEEVFAALSKGIKEGIEPIEDKTKVGKEEITKMLEAAIAIAKGNE